MYYFFFFEDLKNSLPFLCFYAAVFLIGDVFHLNSLSYGFFSYFITLLCFDPFLQNKYWLEQFYFTTKVSTYLKVYFVTKALINSSAALGLWLLAATPLTLHQALLVFMILFFNILICHLVTFLFDELLPDFLMPLLNLSIVSFNGFFLSAGLEKLLPIAEIKIQVALYLLVFPILNQSFSFLLSLKFDSFFNQ